MLDWARRIVGDTRAMRAGDPRAQARPGRAAAHRRDPDRAGDGGDAHHALSRAASRRAVHHLVAHLDRDPRRCWKISRSMPASPISTTSRSAASTRCRSTSERYRLLTAADAPLGNRDKVTWAEVAQVPLCLLTPDMQNRRIIDAAAARAPAANPRPTLESNSMILLFSHVRTGRWASVMPAQVAETLGLTDTHPRHPDRRAGSRAHHRPGGAGARADDAAQRRAGRGGATRRRSSLARSATRNGRID